MTSSDDLEAGLLALGETLDVPSPPPAEVARAVRARLEALPVADGPPEPVAEAVRARLGSVEDADRPSPVRRAWRALRPGARPRRRAIVSVVAILLALFFGATPAGRAAVVEVLRFAGVELRIGDPGPLPSGVPSPLPGERRVTLEQAREQVAFAISVPSRLGEPSEVRVSDGGRVVSLFWPGVRLDEYDGVLQVAFRKELGPPWPDEVSLGTSQAWWIPAKHGLTYLPRGGGEASARARLADPTLIWQQKGVGLRLEGVGDLQGALEIARSAL
ncbi:hypothetical protein [Streptosporangium sp. 'caverna']|uniref:hypothetical protein n=1 Tax=Streptosporangium sp. 'caverna' TaxID=2202249 RepID=UPI000D7DDC18|nr:hypothetical protein [Streptosporangium sp. 'caverna']AWS40539.1 hypothetical protein DKM19_03495 [Streptosporangium sp. 'caverna']